MASLAAMQRLADREALRLEITQHLTVRWAGRAVCRLRGRIDAHAHCDPRDKEPGMICVKRGVVDWRDAIRHEVAHFAPGGNGHGLGFVMARAAQGHRGAKRHLVAIGARRCPKHFWSRRRVKSRTVSAKGITIVYSAYCTECGKEIG